MRSLRTLRKALDIVIAVVCLIIGGALAINFLELSRFYRIAYGLLYTLVAVSLIVSIVMDREQKHTVPQSPPIAPIVEEPRLPMKANPYNKNTRNIISNILK